jgi:hypothetical protein
LSPITSNSSIVDPAVCLSTPFSTTSTNVTHAVARKNTHNY